MKQKLNDTFAKQNYISCTKMKNILYQKNYKLFTSKSKCHIMYQNKDYAHIHFFITKTKTYQIVNKQSNNK